MGRTIGTGTFSSVRQVFYKKKSSHVSFALKILSKNKILELKQLDHLREEKNILQEATHPFLVKLYRSFQDGDNVYLLFEFVHGGELFSRLKLMKRLSESAALFYAAQLLLALEYLHSLDIIYRDVKPENILLDQEGNVKLVDFGFAKKLPNGKRTMTICGTPEYLAPELIKQSNGYGPSVDIWAFGVLLFELLEGHPPFYDQNPLSIYRKILNGKYRAPNQSPDLRDLLEKLLQVNPEQRLGCQGISDLKQHSAFRGINFSKILSKEVEAPWKPNLGSWDDNKHFDQYDEVPLCSSKRDFGTIFEEFN